MTADGLQRTHGLGEPLPQRVAVLRALQLGDMLCAVPAFRALRAALPDAEIILVGLPWAAAFVERFSAYLDGLLEFPGYPGLPERTPQLDQVPTFLTAARQQRFDLAVQMHGNGTLTNPLTVLLGARHRAGFFVPGQFCPDPDRFLPYPDLEPEVRRCLRLVEFLGAPPQGDHLEFPLSDEDHEALHDIPEARHLQPGSYVCVHPGARAADRRWPPDRFAAVADNLAARGLPVVLTGAAEEAHLTAAVAHAMATPPLDLTGRTSLGALAALLQGARLAVCNDTGVSHVATAVGAPSVVIFSASEMHRWAPPDRERHRAVSARAGATPADVLAQAEELLKKEGAHAV